MPGSMPLALAVCCGALALACGSSTPAPAPRPAPPVVAATVRPPEPAPGPDAEEQARHDEIAAAHRQLEAEQQEAFAATCDEPEPRTPHPRCLPSCYPTEPVDPRAGKRLAGAVEIRHVVCEQPGDAAHTRPLVHAGELDGAALAVRKARGRFPPAHKKGTWQAEVVALLAAQGWKPARGDVMRVAGAWRKRVHPVTRERLRCVTVSQYTRSPRKALDGCGGDGSLACEATGNAAARGINVVHYRLVEARRLQAAGKTADCQQAALEAIAVARGLPRWRQYMKLNVATWVDHALYRTRFDGALDEDTLFATAATLGTDAETVYASCGGATGAPTTVAQEQSFHTCW